MPHVPAHERRRVFVDAAVKVIAEEGVARATTRRIAETAGMPTASLHYCFDSKDDLLRAVADAEKILSVVDARTRPGAGLEAGVEGVLRGYVRWFVSSPQLQQAQYELIFWALRKTDHQHIPARAYRAFVDSITQLLREAANDEDPPVDLQSLARQLVAVLDGHMLQAIAATDHQILVGGIELSIQQIHAWIRAERERRTG